MSDWSTVTRGKGGNNNKQQNPKGQGEGKNAEPSNSKNPVSPRGNNNSNNNYKNKGNNNYKGNNDKRGGGAGQKQPQEFAQAKERAAELLDCNAGAVQIFTAQEDPFNPTNKLDGAICRADGPNYGTMVITKVNEVTLNTPRLIHGTPKMEKLTPDHAKISSLPTEGASFFFANKWNGENVCFFKYTDNSGKVFVSCRPRGHAFVKDGNGSVTFSLVSAFLPVNTDLANLPEPLKKLELPTVQSITFELCGTKVPELVKYDFPSEFKPLFINDYKGKITPFAVHGFDKKELPGKFVSSSTPIPPDDSPFKDRLSYWMLDGPFTPFTTETSISNQVGGFVKKYRSSSSSLNAEFRSANKIPQGYYFGCFAIEGKVLYILGPDMTLLHHRLLFKLKPADIEQSHTAIFDNLGQIKAIEALTKLYKKGENLTEEKLRSEMDLSGREWAYFGKDVMSLVEGIPNVFDAKRTLSKQKMLILVGLPGSGKSTVANRMVQQSASNAAEAKADSQMKSSGGVEKKSEKKAPLSLSSWYRVNQDEMGSRHQCEQRAKEAFVLGKSVVVDRCNFDLRQRNTWVKLAAQHEINDIRCIFLDTAPEVCKQRVTVRENHPTIPTGTVGHGIIDKFIDQLIPPLQGEGFTTVTRVQNDAELEEILKIVIPLADRNAPTNLANSGKKNNSNAKGGESDAPPTMNAFALLGGGDDVNDDDDE